MLEDLTQRLESVFHKLRGYGKLTEKNITDSMKKAIKQINRMQEIMVNLPGNRIHKIKLKNNELQQKILDAIDAAF